MKLTPRAEGNPAHHLPENGHPASASAVLAAQVGAAERLARALVAGFDLCCDARAPLTQLQMVALLKAALLEFDGLEAEVRGSMAIDAALRRLRGEG